MNNKLEASELVLNDNGSVYHIALKDEDIADNVILVGDPGRVDVVSSFFESIELERSHREFRTITGHYNGKRITVLATGIGTDNIDIVLNELDAAVNIDLESREIKSQHRSLNLIRLGTCGALHSDLAVDTQIATSHALGFDGLAHYYEHQFEEEELELIHHFLEQSSWPKKLSEPYMIQADQGLLNKLASGLATGATATATGFYGPQGRALRLGLSIQDMHERLRAFEHGDLRILNFEMESSALYFMAKALGHKALTICTVVANRSRMEFSKDYKSSVKVMIENCLERLTS